MLYLSQLCADVFLTDAYAAPHLFAGFLDFCARFAARVPTTGPLAPLFQTLRVENQILAAQTRTELKRLAQAGAVAGASAATATGAELTRALNRVQFNETLLRDHLLVAEPAERQRLYQLLYPGGALRHYVSLAPGTTLAQRLASYLANVQREAVALGESFVANTVADLAAFAAVVPPKASAQPHTTTSYLVPKLTRQLTHAYHLLSAHYRGERLAEVLVYFSPFYFDLGVASPTTNQEVLPPLHQHSSFDLGDFPQAVQLFVAVQQGGPLRVARIAKRTAYPPADALLVPVGSTLTVALAEVPGSGPFVVLCNDSIWQTWYEARLR